MLTSEALSVVSTVATSETVSTLITIVLSILAFGLPTLAAIVVKYAGKLDKKADEFITANVKNAKLAKLLIVAEGIVFKIIEVKTGPLAEKMKKALTDDKTPGKLSPEEIEELHAMVIEEFVKEAGAEFVDALKEEFPQFKSLIVYLIKKYFDAQVKKK